MNSTIALGAGCPASAEAPCYYWHQQLMAQRNKGSQADNRIGTVRFVTESRGSVSVRDCVALPTWVISPKANLGVSWAYARWCFLTLYRSVSRLILSSFEAFVLLP